MEQEVGEVVKMERVDIAPKGRMMLAQGKTLG